MLIGITRVFGRMNSVPLDLKESREPFEISSPGNTSKEDVAVRPVKHNVERFLAANSLSLQGREPRMSESGQAGQALIVASRRARVCDWSHR